jgi:hypothetical protein
VSRLTSRIESLKHRRRRLESYTALKLLTTDDLARALGLVERGEVLPNGEVRNPEVYRQASRKELAALERWVELCGEPLDHLEAAEELLDRMGDAHGWRSPEARDAALLRERLELPGANSWLVEKTAEAVVRLYAELAEHGGQPRHPALKGAVRRLERLREIEYVRPAPDTDVLPKAHPGRLEDAESDAPQTGGNPRSVGGFQPLKVSEERPYMIRREPRIGGGEH